MTKGHMLKKNNRCRKEKKLHYFMEISSFVHCLLNVFLNLWILVIMKGWGLIPLSCQKITWKLNLWRYSAIVIKFGDFFFRLFIWWLTFEINIKLLSISLCDTESSIFRKFSFKYFSPQFIFENIIFPVYAFRKSINSN